MLNARFVVTIVVLTAAALGSWYLSRMYTDTEIVEPLDNTVSDGFYLRTAQILGTDGAGNLLYEIEADYARQQENSNIELQNVRIRYSDNVQVPWTIDADRAMITNEQDLLRLSGHVTAFSYEGFSGEITEIRASILDIDPKTYRAETDGSVQLRIGSRSLTATGMLALLQENRLELKSNVSGNFIP